MGFVAGREECEEEEEEEEEDGGRHQRLRRVAQKSSVICEAYATDSYCWRHYRTVTQIPGRSLSKASSLAGRAWEVLHRVSLRGPGPGPCLSPDTPSYKAALFPCAFDRWV
ncbi:hypothetical protein AK812_SmicGene22979 [Symbiodinium microadriaticum]|uniref:Uncharacterized protein n=1 Tax=Symbiodinium microadriaticum TaxID=2951 RepID=A0A1Q9DIG2_SYMMI|nr:hypothetical protein AK812_SmicGene22979 [Symbiodinium microadriaticum]